MPFSRFAAAWLSVVILAACADQAPTAPTDDDPPVVEPTDDVPDAAISWLSSGTWWETRGWWRLARTPTAPRSSSG